MNIYHNSSKYSVQPEAMSSSKIQAVVLALAGGVGAYYGLNYSPNIADIDTDAIIQAYISVSVTLLGFGMATLSVLSALTSHVLVKNMQKTGHFKHLLTELYVTSGLFFILLIDSLIALFLPESIIDKVLVISTALLFAAFSMLASSGNKFYIVLSNLSQPASNRID